MRINYTMRSVRLTGGSRVILEIANGLVDRGHEVTVTTLGKPKDLAWIPVKFNVRFVNDSLLVKVVRRVAGGLNIDWDEVSRTTKALALRIPECDINVATMCFTAFSVLRSGKGIPFYHMQHYEPVFFPHDGYLRRMSRETYDLNINRIVNSIWLRNKLALEHDVSDVTLINPALNHEIFLADGAKRERSGLTVFSLGRPEPVKGFREALEAMRTVMRQRNDVRWIVFGNRRDGLPTDPAVPYTFVKSPMNEELATLYRSADIVISPSWYESFPLPPLESMACGTPVVTTKPGTEDYAIDNVNALVVPPKDPVSLAHAILRLAEDENLRDKLADEGLKTSAQYTWDRTVSRAESLFAAAYSTY